MKLALQQSMTSSSYEAEDIETLMRKEEIPFLHPPLQRPKSFPNIKSGNASQLGAFLMIPTMEILRGKSFNDFITSNTSTNLSPITSTASFDDSDGQASTTTKQVTKSCKNCCFIFRVPSSSTSSSRLCLSSSSSSSSLCRSTSFNRLPPSFSPATKKRSVSEEEIIFEQSQEDEEQQFMVDGSSSSNSSSNSRKKEIIIPQPCVSPSPLSPMKLTEFCSKDCETSYSLFYANSSILPSPQRERGERIKQEQEKEKEKDACRIAEIRQSIYAFQQQLLKQESMITTTTTTTATTPPAVTTLPTTVVEGRSSSHYESKQTSERTIEKPLTGCLSKANSEESIDLLQFIDITQWWKSPTSNNEAKEEREEKEGREADINNGGVTSNENSPLTTPTVSIGKKKVGNNGSPQFSLTEEQQQEKDLQKAAKKKFDTKYFEELKKEKQQQPSSSSSSSSSSKKQQSSKERKGKKETQQQREIQQRQRIPSSEMSSDSTTTTGFLSSFFGFTQPKPLRPQLHAFI
jgi:hypothetical protein